MRYWVVKGETRVFACDSYDEIAEQSTWWTKKPPKEWERGDRCFFWSKSPTRKIVELGVLDEVLTEKDEFGATLFNVSFLTPLLKHQISIDELRKIFSNDIPYFLKRGPSGTLFPLTENQGEKIYRLVVQHNPEFKNIWSDIYRKIKQNNTMPDVDISVIEGRRSLKTHLRRERNPKIVSAKKTQVLKKTGNLKCEVCDFDFEKFYGEKLGHGFCEAHHKNPISEHNAERETKLKDLAIICSNCHRMIHRTKPMMSIKKFKKFLGK